MVTGTTTTRLVKTLVLVMIFQGMQNLRTHTAIFNNDLIWKTFHSPDLSPSSTQNSTIDHSIESFGVAMDEYGRLGYVHDPTVLHEHGTKFNINSLSLEEKTQLCAPIGEGLEGGNEIGKQFFGHHIQVYRNATKQKTIKVFCAIYTYHGNKKQTDAIRETWGKRCDGFMAASTQTIREQATVNLIHQGGFHGMYQGIWQKVRSMLKYIYDNFLGEYDYFFFCGDDTYVIMENLKFYLTDLEVTYHKTSANDSSYVYAGAWIHPFWLSKKGYDFDFYYLAGASGYVLCRNTVRELVERILPNCHSTTIDSAEDVYMAECLRNYLNVTGYDTRDDQGRDRFIAYDPIQRILVQNPLDAAVTKDNSTIGKEIRAQHAWFQKQHKLSPIYGIDSISPWAVSFHLVHPAMKMKRYERFFYQNNNDLNDKELDCSDTLTM